MSSKRSKVAIFATLLALLVAGFAWWMSNGSTPSTERAGSGSGANSSDGTRSVKAPRVRAPYPATAAAPPSAMTEAHELVVPGMGHVRCPHDGVVDAGALAGWTLPSGPEAQRVYFVDLVGEELLASVERPEGETILIDRHYQPLAYLSWQDAFDGTWGDCQLSALEPGVVRGRLVWADGSPATGEHVVTCPGEIRVADQGGRFSFDLPRGVTCYPMGFVETEDGGFGRGRPVGVTGGETSEIVVTMPSDEDIWTLEQQRKLLGQLALMLSDAEDGRKDAFSQMGRVEDATPEAKRVVASWQEQTQFETKERYDELEFLLSPDAGAEEFKDAWLLGVGM